MKTIQGVKVIESIDDFLQDCELSNRFYEFSNQKDCDFINEPERAERCEEAAKDCEDGCFHWEHIDDFREFGNRLIDDAEKSIDNEFDEYPHEHTSTIEECRKSFATCCDDLEKWHRANGSYEQQGG